jgi:ketosteroid isomerase-like protein
VRLGYEAGNRHDFEAMTLLFHPAGEFVPPTEFAGLGIRRACGREQRIEAQREWHQVWDDFRMEPEQMIEFDDRLIVFGRISGSGFASGVGIGNEWGEVIEIRDGRAIREEVFFSHAALLEAAGLSG